MGGQLAEWLRHWILNHEIMGSSPAVCSKYSVPRVPGQDLYPKSAPVHSAINENLAIHKENIDHPWCLVACIRVVCSVEELRRCWCTGVPVVNNM